MGVENTDFERRVLAHEQILQVLIAHTEIFGPATASIYETPHIGRWRAGLHRYGRISTAPYPAGGAPERQSAPQLGLPSIYS
jgi:hypothetical protein